jgi:hypothetical protein
MTHRERCSNDRCDIALLNQTADALFHLVIVADRDRRVDVAGDPCFGMCRRSSATNRCMRNSLPLASRAASSPRT